MYGAGAPSFSLEPEPTQVGRNRSWSRLRDLGHQEPEPELPKKVAAPQHGLHILHFKGIPYDNKNYRSEEWQSDKDGCAQHGYQCTVHSVSFLYRIGTGTVLLHMEINSVEGARSVLDPYSFVYGSVSSLYI